LHAGEHSAPSATVVDASDDVDNDIDILAQEELISDEGSRLSVCASL